MLNDLRPVIEDNHECEFVSVDCDICSDCKEHTEFCAECGSECCGASQLEVG